MKYLAWLAWLTAFSIIVDIMPVARANSNLFIYKTGFSLLSQCESTDGTQNMFCYGYIVGIVDYASFNSGASFCLYPTVVIGQLNLVVTKYLRQNPQLLHYNAANLVIDALTAAFPCKN
jgi:hypothetical protein